MITFALASLLLLNALAALTLEKSYFYLPRAELKRQAAAKNPLAATLFRAATYQTNLKILLWFIVGLSAAGGFVLFARVAPPLLGFLVVVLTLWFAFIWLPRTRLTALGAQLAVWCTPFIVALLRLLYPLTKYLSVIIGRYSLGPHTGLYQRDDLFELLERQKQQSDSRIDDEELELMRDVLQFGDYTVHEVLIPRTQVKAVSLDDSLGPVLLDELHAAGHSRFPVYDGKPTNIVGVLSIDDVSEVKQHSRVRDHCHKRLAFVNEADSLAQALGAFYQTKQSFFIVVNNFNEYVGIITLHDILHKLTSAAKHDPTIRHDDRKAVATHHAHKKEKSEKPEEKVAQEPTEVVE